YGGDLSHRHPKALQSTGTPGEPSPGLPQAPREDQGRGAGEPPSSHSAEAPGSCSNEPTGPAGSRLCPSRSSHGPRDPRPQDITLPKQRPNRAQGSRPQQAATGQQQSPYFWPSNCWEPENTDYAIYLCKRTMQNKARLELADYEAENLARLQRAFARKWEFIFMQAEAQVKIDRKKDKAERKILDSQERAFWDVHRPVPGCVNTTEMDIRKCRREKNPHRVKKSVYGVPDDGQSQPSPVHISSQPSRKPTKEDVQKEITFLNIQLDRHCMKVSKVADSLMTYTEQFMEYDPFVSGVEPSNPWISDDTTFWDMEASRDPSQQRVKKWGFSLEEALKDPAGRDQFLKFLESEFSSENLRFWLAVQDMKRRPLQEVSTRAQEIWQEFLAEGAPSSINLDSHSYELTSQNLKDPGRYSFEDAQEHIFKLMKSDSYARFLRSNIYQDLLLARKKQPADTEQGRRTSLEKFTRSVGKSLTGKRLTGLMQSS
ncbi:Regulator of G-protein signaling 6, partial [Ataeniobius toweri]|nr:Regulator of G-protein signaling 6 [Ataeniobius toweri]